MKSGSFAGYVWRDEMKHFAAVCALIVGLSVPLLLDVLLVKWMLRYHMNDFGKFYYSARLFLDGQDMYAPSPATLIPVTDVQWLQFTNMNPPHFHLVLLPLALLQPYAALLCWLGLSIACLVMSARLVVRELGWAKVSGTSAAFGLLYLVSWVGTGSLLHTGQLSWLLLWPMTASWVAMRKGRWNAAGWLTGLLASVKPFLLILLPYFAIRRQWRALAASAASFVLAFVVGLITFGYGAHLSWVRSLSGADWTWAVMNGSLLGFLSRAFSESPQLRPALLLAEYVNMLWLMGSLIGLSATIWTIARRPGEVDRAVALLVLASLLFSPLGWVYYLWLLAPPILALGLGGFATRHRALLVIPILASLWPVPFSRVGQPSALATLMIGSVYFWAYLLLWLALLIDAPQAGRESP